MPTEVPPSMEALEELFVNNGDLHKIETYLNRFNPIKTMRMEDMEIRHSSILAWLLDPHESHGFGDKFLRGFLCAAMCGKTESGSPTALEISMADLRDVEVRREWRHIDICIFLRRLGWAFIIENKFQSSQHDGQLEKYKERVESIFNHQEKNIKVRGVFLTLYGETPSDASFATIRYKTIHEILTDLIDREAEAIKNQVSTFVGHYIDIIGEKLGMSKELQDMKNLARNLYQSHKKVIDFIMKHGAATDFSIALENIVGRNPEYKLKFQVGGRNFRYFQHYYNSTIVFLPEKWIDSLGRNESNWAKWEQWEGCQRSWYEGFPLMCELVLAGGNERRSGDLRLSAYVGPIADRDLRKRLIEKISNTKLANIGFRGSATGLRERNSNFFKNNTSPIEDIQDNEKIEEGVRDLLGRFESTFDDVERILRQFAECKTTTDE